MSTLILHYFLLSCMRFQDFFELPRKQHNIAYYTAIIYIIHSFFKAAGIDFGLKSNITIFCCAKSAIFAPILSREQVRRRIPGATDAAAA